MEKVLFVDATYETCKEAVDKVFETFPLDLAGKNICIKVNALKACNPEELPYVTDYRVLDAVIKNVERRGPASILVGDSVGTESYGKSEYVFQTAKLAETAGKYYKNFNKNLVLREISEPKPRTVACLRDVLEADVYISVPKMKTHGLTMISGAMKNNYGIFTGAQKSWFHYVSVKPELFATGLLEAFNMRRPDLVVMDGIMAMEGYGPSSREINYANKIIGGTDCVAIDTAFAHMIGFTVDDVPILQLARERKLGETDLRNIEIVGSTKLSKPYHIPTPANATYSYKAGVGTGVTNISFYRDRVAWRPTIDRDLCLSHEPCRTNPLCIQNCPTGSLYRDDPVGCNKQTCIVCSSCMEWCPVQALVLQPDPEILERLKQHEKDNNYPVFD